MRQSLQKNKIQGWSRIGSTYKRKKIPKSKFEMKRPSKKEIQGRKFETKQPAKRSSKVQAEVEKTKAEVEALQKNWSCLKVQSKKPNRWDLQKKKPEEKKIQNEVDRKSKVISEPNQIRKKLDFESKVCFKYYSGFPNWGWMILILVEYRPNLIKAKYSFFD